MSDSYLKLAQSKISSFVMGSFRIFLKHRWWKTFNICSILAVIFYVSLASLVTDTTMLLYNHIFVAVLTTKDVHIGCKHWNTEATLPTPQFTSASAQFTKIVYFTKCHVTRISDQ